MSRKILHYSPLSFPSVGGVQIAVHSIIEQQQKMGYDARLLTSRSNAKRQPAGLNYPVYSLPPRATTFFDKLEKLPGSLGRRWLAQILRRLHKQWPFEVLHVHLGFPPGFHASLFASEFGGPTLVTCQGIDVQENTSFNYGFRIYDVKNPARIKNGLSCYDHITVVGESMTEDIAELGLPLDNVHVISNGADFSRVSQQQVNSIEVRKKWGIPANTKLLVCLGRNAPKKNFGSLVKTAKRLKLFTDDFLIILVGPGNEVIVQDATENGLGAHIRAIGNADEGVKADKDGVTRLPTNGVIELLRSSDAFVFPTLLEGLPLVVLEGMAAGLPIFTTDAPGCRGLIHHEINGFVSPAGDAEALASNLKLIWTEPDKVKQVARHGSEEAAKNCNWSALNKKYENLYSRAKRV